MERVYSVEINGRTLESRNLRQLLARAVSAKRNPNRETMLRSKIYGQFHPPDGSKSCPLSEMAVMHQ